MAQDGRNKAHAPYDRVKIRDRNMPVDLQFIDPQFIDPQFIDLQSVDLQSIGLQLKRSKKTL